MARQKENTERINIFLAPDALEKLKDKANEMGMTVSGIVRMIVLEYLNKKS